MAATEGEVLQFCRSLQGSVHSVVRSLTRMSLSFCTALEAQILVRALGKPVLWRRLSPCEEGKNEKGVPGAESTPVSSLPTFREGGRCPPSQSRQ